MNLFFPTLISRIFEPVVVFSVLILVALTRSGLEGFAYYRFIGIFFLLMVLPPMSFLIWAVKTKKVSNWDIGDRKQRAYALKIFLGFQIFNILLTWLYGNEYMMRLITFFFLWFLGFYLITLFWKISGHSGVATLGAILLISWYGWAWWPLLIVLPQVCWARIVRKDHTIGQVVGGVIYSVAATLLSSSLYVNR